MPFSWTLETRQCAGLTDTLFPRGGLSGKFELAVNRDGFLAFRFKGADVVDGVSDWHCGRPVGSTQPPQPPPNVSSPMSPGSSTSSFGLMASIARFNCWPRKERCPACMDADAMVPLRSPEAAARLHPSLRTIGQYLPLPNVIPDRAKKAVLLSRREVDALLPPVEPRDYDGIPMAGGVLHVDEGEGRVRLARFEWVDVTGAPENPAESLERQRAWPLRPYDAKVLQRYTKAGKIPCIRNVTGNVAFYSAETGLFYCGHETATIFREWGQDGFCGPTNGLQCAACVLINRVPPHLAELAQCRVPMMAALPPGLQWTAWSSRRTFGCDFQARGEAEQRRAEAAGRLRKKFEAIYVALRSAGMIHDLADLATQYAAVVRVPDEMALVPCNAVYY